MSTNPTHLEQQNQTEQQNKAPVSSIRTHSGFTLWLDGLRCKLTVHAWRRRTKKARRRHSFRQVLARVPHANLIGDALYMIGFWVEYAVVCAVRGTYKVASAIGMNAARLLVVIIRPFALGIITLCEDIVEPFQVVGSGIRHFRAISDELSDESAHTIRKEKLRYFAHAARQFLPLLLNALSYIMPVAAAAGFLYVVQSGLNQNVVLNVQVNGTSVGTVASEQVFESAREDVRSRITNAEAVMASTGAQVSDDSWDVTPTYTLESGSSTMTETEAADAILCASSDQIGEATAVYVDDSLRFVTTEGDHLRTYLESIKAPYVNAMDQNKRVSFVHDIKLVDGIYLLSSILDYNNVISTLNQGGGPTYYTAAAGDTVQTVVDNTGVSWDTLAALNPDLTGTDEVLDEGTAVMTGVSHPDMLQIKEVVRSTYTEPIPFDTQTSESDEYDFGKTVVVQEGADGTEEITRETTYIDGVESSSEVVNYKVLQNPTTQLIVKGTKLASGMVARIGSGTFVWPVPNYTYVSRWMSSYHKGADICAAYGTPIIASDSGKVVTAGWHYSYGNYVIIDHGNGYRTLYAHMSQLKCTAGQAVNQGDVIGLVGSTGDSTGNHCHFEMYYNGARFSAQTYFGGMRASR